MKLFISASKIFFSSAFSMILLLILLLSITSATFIENSFDAVTAKLLIYNNTWFELLLALLAINLIGTLWKKKLFRKEKLASLTFHLSFIILIFGAGITRHFGSDGDMHIREGESSNLVYSNEPYFYISDIRNGKTIYSASPLQFSQLVKNSFNMRFQINGNKNVDFEFVNYFSNATEYLAEYPDKENDVIELSIIVENRTVTTYIQKGTIKSIGKLNIAYNTIDSADIRITDSKGQLKISSPLDIDKFSPGGKFPELIKKDSSGNFEETKVYSVGGELFRFTKHHKNKRVSYMSTNDKSIEKDVLIFNASYQNQHKKLSITYDRDRYMQLPVRCDFKDLQLDISYGPKPLEIPFSVHLDDFILINYPGSDYPSSLESRITLIDKKNSLKEQFVISKNKVFNYNGYRFFQTLYDADEKGTILSVNHDFYGTITTYLGYLLLGLGFLFTFFSKTSRFNELNKLIKEIGNKKIFSLIVILIGISSPNTAIAQTDFSNHVSKGHVNKFERLLVQSESGRFQPVNTLAYNIMRKISKRNFALVEGNIRISPAQALLEMLVNPEYWKNQKIIYVGATSITEKLGLSSKYVSFNQLFDKNMQYVLKEELKISFNKREREQTILDKEIIKLTERVNVLLLLFNGHFIKIFPEQSSKNNKWLAWNDSLAYQPLKGKLALINADFQFDVLNYNKIMIAYFLSLKEAISSNDYSRPEQIIEYIISIQKSLTDKNLLPSQLNIRLEIIYNRIQIFFILMFAYAFSGILLIFGFPLFGKYLQESKLLILKKIVTSILFASLLLHFTSMIVRWIISSHAPWSNAYEVLLFVSFCLVLSGFILSKNTKILIGASALMASALLMAAELSNLDPQLTNLQPVLKSNWLVFHVATISAGYSLFAFSMIIGMINIVYYLIKNNENQSRIEKQINKYSYINEQIISIGLFLATIGTFLGGVWANESWGRYWGWDPKETWSLAIVIVYAVILHIRFIPRLYNLMVFNVGTIIAFGTVIMTFVGVNYYFKEGLHSYATDDPPLFPLWAWITIFLIVTLIIAAIIKEKKYKATKANK